MGNQQDSDLAYALFARCEEARSNLWSQMHDRGLRCADGWHIHETTRHANGRTTIVMRPIHMKLPAPPDLECSCSIDAPGDDISSHCGV